MKKYISILRGVNVSGQKKVNMNELRDLYVSLGFDEVRTYIQSGNVIFRYNAYDPQELAEKIEHSIAEKYGFHVDVLLRTADEWEQIVDRNPFVNIDGINTDKLHVTFLSSAPHQTAIDKLSEYSSGADKFLLSGKEVYVYCPDGYGKTKLNNTFFEKKMKVTATTRNWKTVNELAAIVSLA